MKGYKVNRKIGWDTHGLPVELEVEKNWVLSKVILKNMALISLIKMP